MSSKIKVDTIENVAGSGNVSLGSGHNLVVPGSISAKGGAVFNEDSADVDFRVESDANTHALFLEGSTGNIGIGTSSPPSYGSTFTILQANNTASGIVQANNSTNSITTEIEAEGTRGAVGTRTNHDFVIKTNQTERMRIDANGRVTKPLQPSFSVGKSAIQNNIGVSSYDTITFDTEVFDVGSNFASNTFTAPVTGKYHLTLNLRLDNVDTAASYYNIGINTSNRSYYQLFQPNHPSDVAYYVQTMTLIADMDANDTANCSVNQHNGTSQTDINTTTVFMGILIG